MYIFSKLNKNYYYYYYYYYHYYYYYYYYHNYNKILKSDWLSTALISALIGQCASRLSNWKVHAATRALSGFFSQLAKNKVLEFLVLWFKKRAYIYHKFSG